MPPRSSSVIKSLCLLLVCQAFLFPDAQAAAWLMEKGKGQFINNLFFYRTDETFSASGDKTRSPRFNKLEYNPYVEYGWKENLTVGASTSLQSLNQKRPGLSDEETMGLGDTELFVRYPLFKGEHSVVSMQPLIKVPGPYDKDDAVPLGQGQVDAEMRLAGGISFEALGRWHYYNVEGAYRKRFESPDDELRLDQTLGLRFADDWTALLQSYQTFSRGDATTGPILVSNSSNFDLTKLQVSLVREMENGMKLQAGAFAHVDGENTGAGEGLLLSLWVNF